MNHPISHILARTLLGALVLCGLTNQGHGQAVKATLVGTITDSSGAIVPGADVVVTQTTTNFKRSALTNEQGNYVVGNLDPGVYRVQVELAGFKKVVRDNVEVLVNSTVRVDLRLEPGEISEQIEVIQTVSLLQTERADIGRKIETKQLADLPLLMNRNFQGLMNLVPGTSRTFRPHSEFFNAQDSISTQVNGQSRMANNVQFEGIDNNHRTGLLTALIPPIEALQTVDITTSNYEAELGRAGGAVTNITLKSGSNDWHGSLYYFNRVSALAATNVFAKSKSPTVFNLFGGNVGGPIRRNRTFFFFNYQGIRDRRGDVTQATIPTPEFRRGDLRASLTATTIYDPATGTAEGIGRVPFPDNVIPESRISPIARKILNLVPAPNLPGLVTNFERATSRKKDTESVDLKIDHQVRGNDTVSFRYSLQQPAIFDPSLFGIYGGPKSGGFAGFGTQRAQNGAINYTRIFSSDLLAEFRIGVMRYRNDAKNEDTGRRTAEEIGIRGANLGDDVTSGITMIHIDGFSSPLVGFSGALPWARAETNFDFVSNWTKIAGNHTLKWGVDVRRNRDDLFTGGWPIGSRGRFDFRAGPTARNGDPSTSFTNAFASFLLDLPNGVGRGLAVTWSSLRQTTLFTYLQDKWQISRKLTLDLGLRHELYFTPTPANPGGFSNYNPRTNSLEVAGIGGVPSNMGRETPLWNFAPRVGVAYRFDDRTVLRAGYGISVDPSFPDDKYAFNFPINQSNTFNPLNSFSAAGSMGSGFLPPLVASIPSDGIIRNAPAGEVFIALPLNLREGYVQSWNIAFQRALPWNFAFEAAYIGNHGVGILTRQNINASTGSGAAGQPLNLAFGRRAATHTWMRTDTNYHSLQAKFDRRFASGFLMTTGYTFGKAINLIDDNGSLYIPIHVALNRGRAGFDRTHAFVQSYIYDLPFGPRGRWLQTGPGRWLLGDWQTNGIFSAYSGLPLNITFSSATLNAPGNGNRPNMNGKPEIFERVGRGVHWFDVSNFSAPGTASFGNAGRNILRGPGYVNLDLSLFRKFPITERLGGEFRVEAFNLTNTPHFSNPGGEFGSANFGQVTGALPDQRQIQFALKFSF